jgi:phospholipase C
MDRREFIKMLGLAGTSATAYAACSAYMQEALAQSDHTIDELLTANGQCDTGSLTDIEHVVFLMQENRSFDHYFGTLRGARGFGDPRPMMMRDGQPIWYQLQAGATSTPPAPTAQRIRPYRMPNIAANKPVDDTSPAGTVGGVFITDPAHDYATGIGAWNNGLSDKWIPQKGIVSMAHYTEADIPLYFKLAKAFTLCDAYFCSINGPTDCNRSYFYAGTSNGKNSNSPFSSVADSVGSAGRAHWKAYPERLEDLGVSWKFYQDGLNWTSGRPFDGNYGDNTLEYFAQYRADFAATSANPAYYASIYQKNQNINSILRTDPSKPSQFEQDIIDNKLPAVSWIVAPEAFCEHPKWSPHFGEYYVHEILRAFTANKDVWKKTVFIITYDENGGFFDHVLPPVPPLNGNIGSISPGITVTSGTTARDANSEATATSSTQPLGMGIRVPTLVISPWSAGGRICSEVFDHTSTLQFLDTWLSANGKQPPGTTFPAFSSWRQAIAGDLTSALDFNRVVPLVDTASVVDPTRLGVSFNATQKANATSAGALTPDLTTFNADPDKDKPTLAKQDKARCEILPLGYDFFVGAHVNATKDRVEYPITNRGKLAASFYVIPYDRTGTFPGDGPWFFSVEGAKDTPVTITADAGAYAAYGATNSATKNYSYAVHGPNGYQFAFKGAAADPLEQQLAEIVNAVAADNGNTVRFTLAWSGANGSLKVINAYTGDSRIVSAGTAASSTTVDIRTADGWYDIAFVDAVNSPSRYLRRYAGHLENGKIGRSDPAIGRFYNVATHIYEDLVAAS